MYRHIHISHFYIFICIIYCILITFFACGACNAAGLQAQPGVELLQQNGGGISEGGGHSDGNPQEGQQGLEGSQCMACMPWVPCLLQLLVAAHQQCANGIAS